MGPEGATSYGNITTGFFYANPAEARRLRVSPQKTSWPPGPYHMGQDYCPILWKEIGPGNLQLDQVPYGLNALDDVNNTLFVNYQEDEAGHCELETGLGYSWQNADTPVLRINAGQTYEANLYYWVGQDNWALQYGKNYNSQYQFNVDKIYSTLVQQTGGIRAPLAQPDYVPPKKPNVDR
jgi:hypothetical protein